jgi:hypothetical protein
VVITVVLVVITVVLVVITVVLWSAWSHNVLHRTVLEKGAPKPPFLIHPVRAVHPFTSASAASV